MTFWRGLHSINEDVAFVFGSSLNILLLIIIEKVEVRSLKKYNVVLLQCWIDIFQIITNFITKPVVFHQESICRKYSNRRAPLLRAWKIDSSPFIRIFTVFFQWWIFSWVTSVCFCMCSMPVSFIFRYRTVCLHKEISRMFYIIVYSVPWIFNFHSN